MKNTERIDDLQYNGLKLIQDTEQFRFGCDAVELANFVGGRKGGRACDLGAGNGIISVLLAAKRNMSVTAVEIQPAAAELCRRNAELNGLGDKICVVNEPMQIFAEKAEKGSFDVVVCNPPYSEVGTGEKSLSESKATARHEIKVKLHEVVSAAAGLCKFGGAFYMVNAVSRLAETLNLLCINKLEPKVLQILTPNETKPPHLFLIKAVLHGKKGIEVLPERPVKAFGV